MTKNIGTPPEISLVSLDPPLYDTLAIVTRKNSYLSNATLRFSRMAEAAIINTFTAHGDGDWHSTAQPT